MNNRGKGKLQESLHIKDPHQNHQQEEQKGEETGTDNKPITLPYLPNLILFEILSRVRIKTLNNCKLVCKTWAGFISTPEFAQLHLSRSPTSCLIQSLNRRLRYKELHFVDPEYPYSPIDKLVFATEINLPNALLGLTNSCNGLVCLFPISPLYHIRSIFIPTTIYVCNPLLREYITLPKPSYVKILLHRWCCALGFSHKTNQYKVILGSLTTGRGDYQAEIYTLGEGSWRSIDVVDSCYVIWNQYFNASVNGALHWLPYGSSHPFICCFDFVTEQFCSVPEPFQFGSLESESCLEMRLGVINGNLSICDYSNGDRIDIWVMKDYGVKESWSKQIVINHMIHKTESDSYESIIITGSGEVLVIFNYDSIMIYDPKSQVFECKLENLGVGSEFHAIAYVPSLISLKDVAKGENLKVLGSN